MRPGAVRSFSGICVHRAEHLDEAAEEPLPEGGFDRPDHLLVAVRRQRAARPSVWTPSCWRTAHRRGRPTACTGASWGIRCRCGGMSPSWGRHRTLPVADPIPQNLAESGGRADVQGAGDLSCCPALGEAVGAHLPLLEGESPTVSVSHGVALFFRRKRGRFLILPCGTQCRFSLWRPAT